MYAKLALENQAMKELIEKSSDAAREARGGRVSGQGAFPFHCTELPLCRAFPVGGGVRGQVLQSPHQFLEPACNLARDTKRGGNKLFVHIHVPLVFGQVTLAVGLIEDTPLFHR